MQPSTAPCSPAPGRRLVIIRIDSQPLSPSFFMSFDAVGKQKPQTQTSSNRRNSSIMNKIALPDEAPPPLKKRWSMLKNMVPFNTPGNDRPGEVTPPSTSSDDIDANGNLGQLEKSSSASKQGPPPSTPPHQAFSFKFSLEWLERPVWPSRNRNLTPPKLPQPAQAILDADPNQHNGHTIAIQPVKPDISDAAATKYAGRALAEWAQVISECDSFFDRRKDEGVPSNKLVETPTLSVESFRLFG